MGEIYMLGKIFGNKYNPKLPLFLGFGESQFLFGTSENIPLDSPDGIAHLTVYPSINNDGDFVENVTVPIAWKSEYFMKIPLLNIRGMPKTGILLYAHPSNPILKFINSEMLSEKAILENQVEKLRQDLLVAQRDARITFEEYKKRMIEAGYVIGAGGKAAKSYSSGANIVAPNQQQQSNREESGDYYG